ncbi:vacuolar protein sorting 55 [Phakopsora pachyrhizi]|uniref:Vacuolar protein sorting 55 n=1 Tax=Phakopsora pachyrhizi TaxID=170000 RepID=A0AAV0BQ44_PHAPC|nr:vacuolar protein sorting 55 [Phakopsora pachyrhizi]CAH7688773.1 vacuolar protein sorting 55 [Phakopsora pachyrhizi]
MLQPGFKTIIFLSIVLALGFLLVILSCALWGQWLPLLAALTFFISPLPKFLASNCMGSDYELSADYSNVPLETADFFTSMLLTTGVALPLVLAHSDIINQSACYMSIAGGALVYTTITVYSHFFTPTDEF